MRQIILQTALLNDNGTQMDYRALANPKLSCLRMTGKRLLKGGRWVGNCIHRSSECVVVVKLQIHIPNANK